MGGPLNSIDRHSPVPYYIQVKESLQEQIRQRSWQPGYQLPSEPDLCRIFGVSRTVIRQALQELANEGLLVREKGRGTFVAEPKISGSLVQRLAGFYEDLVSQGYTPTTYVLRQEVVPAPPTVAAYLGVKTGTAVIEIERLRFIQDEPLVLATTYLPHALCPAVLHADLSNQSLYALLEEQCGLSIARGYRIVEAVLPNEHQARLLAVDKSSPLIKLKSVTFLNDGTPLEYYQAYYRGDRLQFKVELVRVREYGKDRMVFDEEAQGLPANFLLLDDHAADSGESVS